MLNLANLKTPGVYVEEVPVFPPSVAAVPTAIPAFIGYTEFAEKDGETLLNKPTRIKSLVEYKLYFGGAPSTNITATLNTQDQVEKIELDPGLCLFYSLQLFYANGGGDCYIVSIETYDNALISIGPDPFVKGIEALKKYDEPTLLVMPETILLADAAAAATAHNAAIDHCAEMQDRFAILDIGYKGSDDKVVDTFRDNLTINNLSYAAAYYPSLKTNLSLEYNYADIKIKKGQNEVTLDTLGGDPKVVEQVKNLVADIKLIKDYHKTSIGDPIKQLNENSASTDQDREDLIKSAVEDFIGLKGSIQYKDSTLPQGIDVNKVDTTEKIFKRYLANDTAYGKRFRELAKEVQVDIDNLLTPPGNQPPGNQPPGNQPPGNQPPGNQPPGNQPPGNQPPGNQPPDRETLLKELIYIDSLFRQEVNNRMKMLEKDLRQTHPVYSRITQAIDRQRIVLPPSGAIAGIYARVDTERGVWKAPANVSLNRVVELTQIIDHKDQERLNVDVNAGKSINAIRFFTGRGILVWGARTLAGNDNEWRYVSVRRFFIMVEESVKKACERFVFEPNDANTWVKVRAMIENFLTLQWRAGALQGVKPEHAFYVKVGLNQTMTAIDILEGRMIVEIGMAVVRPAEFIVLRFMQKMPES